MRISKTCLFAMISAGGFVSSACGVHQTAGGDSGAWTSTGGDGGSTGGDGGSTGGDGGSTGGDGGSTAVSEAPVVTTVDAWCYEHSTGKSDFIWQVDATFTDPQGDDTTQAWFTGITVYEGDAKGSPIADYSLTCPEPGVCGGSFRESMDNIRCSLASAYTITVRVQDEDDNWSDPLGTTGRTCPSSDPC